MNIENGLREPFQQSGRRFDTGAPGQFAAAKSGPAAVMVKQTAIDQIGKIRPIDGYLPSIPMAKPRAAHINSGPMSIAFRQFRGQAQNFIFGRETLARLLDRLLGK